MTNLNLLWAYSVTDKAFQPRNSGASAVRSSNPDSGGYGKLTVYPTIVQVTSPLGKAIGLVIPQNSVTPGSA
jgi:hypothetical protein